MTLTTEDMQTIKTLLGEHQKEIARKIETEVTNLERTIETKAEFAGARIQAGLEKQLRTSEENLNKRFDKIDAALTRIGQDLVGFIGDIHQDQEKVNKRYEKRIEKLETTVFAS